MGDRCFLVLFEKDYEDKFEYLGGYTSAKGKARIRCKTCGTEFEKWGNFASQGANIGCPTCRVRAFDNSSAPKDGRLLEHIVELYESGQANYTIAQEYGLQVKVVGRLLRAAGFDTSQNRDGLNRKKPAPKWKPINLKDTEASLKAWRAYANAISAEVLKIPKPQAVSLKHEPDVYICGHCGERRLFFPSYEHYGRKKPPKYCSQRCRKRAAKRNRQSSNIGHRLRKYGSGDKPRDVIRLDALIERDEGVCHICGKQIDKNDMRTTSAGYPYVGDLYPSIDHVVPLARGGTHTWENVKLAHRLCNSLKGVSLEYRGEIRVKS